MTYLLTPLPEGAEMRLPDVTRSLNHRDFSEMWSIFNYIGLKWEDKEFSIVGKKELRHVVLRKTRLRPSYFTEYSEAASILRCLRTELGEEKALEQLFYVPPGMANFPATRLGHIRKFVIGEFINYQVSQGAFRKFGYVNYRGYRGGRYSDPKHLPYRAFEDA